MSQDVISPEHASQQHVGDALEGPFGLALPPLSASILMIVAAVLLGHLIRIAVQPYTFWFDEAMLLVNIREIGWRELLAPLPFYDQGAPLLYLGLLKALYAIAGNNELLLRLPSLLAVVAAVAAVLRLPRLSPIERCIAVAAIVGSDIVARTATDVKPYTIDFMWSVVLMVVFHPDSRSGAATWAGRGIILLVAMMSATSFPFMALAIGASLVWVRLRRSPAGLGSRLRAALPDASLFAIVLVLYAVYYIGYVRPTSATVIANHAFTFEGIGYFQGHGSYLSWLAHRLLAILFSHYEIMCMLVLLIGLLGLFRLAQQRSIYALQMLILMLALIGANLARVYPIIEDRFTLFLLPWIGIAAGAGVGMIFARVPNALARTLLGLVLAAALLWPAVVFLQDPLRQDARQTLAFLASDPKTPVVLTMGAQPTYDLYMGSDGTPVGLRCDVQGKPGMTNRCMLPRAPGDGTFLGHDTKWYLLNYVAVAGWGGNDHGFPGPSVKEFAAHYWDFIASELKRAGRSYLFVLAHSRGDVVEIEKRAAVYGRLSLVLDERPSTPSRGFGSAQLWLFQPYE
jgi:hypothetical protein